MQTGRKLVTMLISLFLAVALWLYVVTTVAPETTARVSAIPINVDGTITLEERGLVITQQDVTSLALEVSTSRVNLSKLNAETIRVNADASKIREPGVYTLPCTVTFPDTVRSSEVDLLRKSVDSVTVTVSNLMRVSMPIQLKWTGSVKEGYLFEADSVTLDPAEVVVYGPEEELDRIAEVQVSYDVSDLEETTVETLPIVFLDESGEPLELSEHISYNISQTSLTLPIFRTKTMTLEVLAIEGGGVTEKNANIVLNPDTIRLKGSTEVIEALADNFVVGTVDLASISDQEELTFPLNLPVGVTNVSGETEVQVTVTLTGVSTDTVPVTDIRLENAPDGYLTEISTRTVHLTVRGSTKEINEIKLNKDNGIYVVVDLAGNTQTGAFTVSGRVYNPDHPSVSVVEEVQIGVVISPLPEPTDEETD